MTKYKLLLLLFGFSFLTIFSQEETNEKIKVPNYTDDYMSKIYQSTLLILTLGLPIIMIIPLSFHQPVKMLTIPTNVGRVIISFF